jgi:mediator of RNA polymerase II transcription subunit 29
MPRFDKHLEEFYSICDQIELHLLTAKRCIQQIHHAQNYLPVPVVPAPIQDNVMNYNQFRELVINQLKYAEDIHDTFLMAAQNMN